MHDDLVGGKKQSLVFAGSEGVLCVVVNVALIRRWSVLRTCPYVAIGTTKRARDMFICPVYRPVLVVGRARSSCLQNALRRRHYSEEVLLITLSGACANNMTTTKR